MTSSRFSTSSYRHLQGVNPKLVALCECALQLSPVDFGIVCGLRSRDEQAQLVSLGRSQTMDSKHLTGEAIDFAPWWGGRFQKDWPFYYPIVDAFIDAGTTMGTRFRWGGAWTEDMNALVMGAQAAQEAYIMKRAAKGTVFLDGPHIELVTEPDATEVA